MYKAYHIFTTIKSLMYQGLSQFFLPPKITVNVLYKLIKVKVRSYPSVKSWPKPSRWNNRSKVRVYQCHKSEREIIILWALLINWDHLILEGPLELYRRVYRFWVDLKASECRSNQGEVCMVLLFRWAGDWDDESFRERWCPILDSSFDLSSQA